MVWEERVSIAPMMGYTDKHFRYLMRQISKHTVLYTEMVTTGALIHGDRPMHLDFNAEEQPLVLQLGGSDANDLAVCAELAEQWGYAAVNINVGCPSDRVQSGRFGACLMKQPEVVAEAVAAMRARVSIPVTVKTRIGVDELDSYEHLVHFISTVAAGGCELFIIHARKAWLKGLSPKQNRDVPPLNYPRVHQLKQDFPALRFAINGGIKDLTMAKLDHADLDGIMIGREAYHDPYTFADVDQTFYASEAPVKSREEILASVIPYIEAEILAKNLPITRMSRHLINLFQGIPGAKQWRRHLSQHAFKKGTGCEVLTDALAFVSEL